MRLFAFALIALFFTPLEVFAFSAKIIKVSDGDTIIVQTANNPQVRVRLYGIDAPEKNQPYGDYAQEKLANLTKTINL